MSDRVCPECGSDTYKSSNYDKQADRARQMNAAFEREAQKAGLASARLSVLSLEHKDCHSRMQRKINRQAKAIRRLEEKLRELKVQPHEGETPANASPVEQSLTW